MEFYSLGVMSKSSSDTTRLDVTPPAIDLPLLSALTTLEVTASLGSLTARLANFLSPIHSAPALSSVIFRDLYRSGTRDIVDNRLAQLAMQVKTKRSVTVVPEGRVVENDPNGKSTSVNLGKREVT